MPQQQQLCMLGLMKPVRPVGRACSAPASVGTEKATSASAPHPGAESLYMAPAAASRALCSSS